MSYYTLKMDIHPIELYLRKYQIEENRNMRFEKLNLSEEQTKTLISKIIEIKYNPKILERYSFFSNNCAGAIHSLLASAGINFKKSILPQKVDNNLKNAGFISDEPAIEIKGIRNYIKGMLAELNLSQEQFIALKDLSDEQIDIITNHARACFQLITMAQLPYPQVTIDKINHSFLEKYPSALYSDFKGMVNLD